MINSFTNHTNRGQDMIVIQKSKTADSRTCNYKETTKEQLYASSGQHIGDVAKGMAFFIDMMEDATQKHDHDKFTDIDGFHRDFSNGFKTTDWWENHKKVNRHHLFDDDGVRYDVNLVDVMELVVDCVMAGMGRSGFVHPLDIKPEVLMKAFNNTVELLKSKVTVQEEQE